MEKGDRFKVKTFFLEIIMIFGEKLQSARSNPLLFEKCEIKISTTNWGHTKFCFLKWGRRKKKFKKPLSNRSLT